MRNMLQRLLLGHVSPVWIVVILLVVSTGARGQCPVTMNVSHTAAQQLTLADVDFEHFQGTNLLFTISLRNDNPALDAVVTLHLTIDINLADNSGSFANAVELTTKPFTVPHSGTRTITNLNLGTGGDIKSETFEFDDAAKSKLQDGALATGQLPAGTYTIHVGLTNLGCTPEVVTIVLRNPSRVELRSPRDDEVTNEFPLFEFYQESDRAVLTVAERTPDQSREDAITRQPSMLEVELSGQNSFLYSGGRPLEDGKTYVWRVVSKVRSAGGTDFDISSTIGEFKVSASAQGNTDDALLNQLEELLGSRYHDVFVQIRNSGFKLTGSYTLNDASLNRNELLDLINQLRQMGGTIDLTFE
jgi:hypothetical protein